MISSILRRISNLEKAFTQSQKKLANVTANSDIAPRLETQVNNNVDDISDNREGIMETFETALTNSSDLEDVRSAIIEIYEMMEG